jgi:hypothetical protein
MVFLPNGHSFLADQLQDQLWNRITSMIVKADINEKDAASNNFER